MAINAADLIARAKSQLGVDYSWGGGGAGGRGYGFDQGAGIYGFDCSSFMQYIFAGFGVSVPRVTYDQVKVGAQVGYKDLKAGDMMFFNQGSRGPEHVGMYIGDGKFIHAPKTGDVIKISDASDPYYRSIFTGGRRVAQIEGGGQFDPNTAPEVEAIPKTPEDLAADYGWAYSFLQSNGELKDTFAKAVDGSWTAQRFKAEVQNTKWYQTHSDVQRSMDVMSKTDPATYKANHRAAIDSLVMQAREMGAVMSGDQVSKMAEDVMRFGMSNEQIVQQMAGYIKFTDEKVMGGRAGQIEKYAKELAYRNGMQVGAQTAKDYAVKIIKGQMTMEQLENNMRTNAAGLYPVYKDQIMAGQDAQELAGSFMSSMADILELDPENISLFDPMIKKAMNGRAAKGPPVGMDITDFENMLRNDPRWKKTANSRDSMMGAGKQALKDFGFNIG